MANRAFRFVGLAAALLACDGNNPDPSDANAPDLPDGPCLDPDGDLVCSAVDNCPLHTNADQLDEDGNGVGDACPLSLADGPWPQASVGAFMPAQRVDLAERYALVRGGDASGEGVAELACGECDGTCGLAFPVPPSELLVSVSSEATWVAWDTAAGARMAHLADTGAASVGPALAVDDAGWLDLLQVTGAGNARYVVGLVDDDSTWLRGFDAATGSSRWQVAAPEPVGGEVPAVPSAVVVMPDARFIILAGGRLFQSRVPADDTVEVATSVTLPSDGTRFHVAHIALDDRARIYLIGHDEFQPPACLYPFTARIPRLRVLGPAFQLLAESAPTNVGPLRVERALEQADVARYRAVVVTVAERCATEDHFYKSPYEFSDDPEDLYACPVTYTQACQQEYPPLSPGASPCCHVGDPGCPEDAAIESCVCAQDNYCCESEWNSYCTDLASSCGGMCPPAESAQCPCHLCLGLLAICPPPLCLADSECFLSNLLEVHELEGDEPTAIVPVARRGFPILMQPWELALDGLGHAVVRGRVIDLNASDPNDADLLELPTEQISAAVVDADAQGGPRIATGWAPEFPIFGETTRVRGGLLVARLGAPAQLVSHTSDLGATTTYISWASDAFKPVWVSRLYPRGDGSLLAVGTAPQNGSAVRVFAPSGDFALGKDLESLPSDQAPPEIDPCPDPDDCVPFDLGTETRERDVFDLSDPEALRWMGCVQRTRTSNGKVVTYPCPEDELRDAWAQSYGSAAMLTNGHRIACVGTATRVETSVSHLGDTTETKLLRCTSWRELFVPDDPPLRTLAQVALWPRLLDAPGCSLYGQPAPTRLLAIRGPELTVTVTGSDGADPAVTTGDEVTVSVSPSGASVEFIVVDGSAQLAGDTDGDGRVTTTDGTLVVTASDEGAIVIVVIVRDAEGNVIGERRVVILVDGPLACAEDEGGFRLCNARPGRVVPEEAEQPSLQSPAEAAVGVQLHDRSLVLHEIDASANDFGLPVTISRTWRGANIPTDGGDLGGWTFGFDQRLVPATDELAWTLVEPRDGGVDLAFLDGTGRADVFKHPGRTEEVSFGAEGGTGPHYWVYDHANQRLRARSFSARVTTYESPRGLFATLRAYTLRIEPGMQARDAHPFYPRAGEASTETQLRPDEARFYELSDPSGTRRIFDCRGLLVRVIDAQYRELELVYGGSASSLTRTPRLRRLIDAAGRAHVFEWTRVGEHERLRRVTSPRGHRVDYVYSADGTRLSSVTVTSKHATDEALDVIETQRYGYDADGRLEVVVEPEASLSEPSMRIEYDGDGRVVRQLLGRDAAPGHQPTGAFADGDDGATWQIVPTATGVVVTDPVGVARTYLLEPLAGNGPKVVSSIAFERDIADASTVAGTTTPGTERVTVETSFEYAASGLVTSVTTPSGRRTELEYDARGELTLRRELPIGGGEADVTRLAFTNANESQFGAFACWVLESEIVPGGAMTLRGYPDFDPSAPGRACQAATLEPPGTVGAGGRSVTWQEAFDYMPDGPMRGELVERRVEIDARAASSITFGFSTPEPAPGSAASFRSGKVPTERLGHPASITLSGEDVGELAAECAGALPPSITTELESDLDGAIIEVREKRVIACSDSSGCDGSCDDGTCLATIRSQRKRDGAGRVVQFVEDAGGDAHTTEHEYDALGRVRRTTIQVKDAFGWMDATYPSGATAISPGDGSPMDTEIFYDRLGRIAGVIRSGDDLDHVLVAAWDAAGNARYRLEQGAGADAALVLELTQALRDAQPSHRIIEQHDPEPLGDDNFAKHDAGDPLRRDPKRVLRTFEHDQAGELVVETLSDGAPASDCAPCDAAHRHRQALYRDRDGLVVAVDVGRTDRLGPGGGRVIQHQVYDAQQRLARQRVLDPIGPPGCGRDVAVKETSWSDFDAAGFPRLEEVRGYDGAAAIDPATGALAEPTCVLDRLLSSRRFERDAMGQVIVERLAVLDGFGVAPATAPTRVTRTLYDHAGRPIESWVDGAAGAKLGLERRHYGYLGEACFEASYLGGAPVRSVHSVYDAAGALASVQERHHGGVEDVVVTQRFRYDRGGRLRDLIDGLGRVMQRTVYDGADRVRGTGDLRGAWQERRYDALGNLVDERFFASAGDVRGTVTTWNGPFKTREEEDWQGDARGGRTFEYGAHGEPVRVVPSGEPLIAETLDNEIGVPWRERTPRGAEHLSTIDALGHVVRIDATLAIDPGTLPSGEPLSLSGRRELRVNALGQVTLARSATAAGAPISTVIQGWTGDDDLRFEEQYRHPAAGGPAAWHRSEATYDVRGDIATLRQEVPGGEPIVLTYTHDAAGRLTGITGRAGASGLFRDNHLDRVSYTWAGALPVERSVSTVSTYLGGARSTVRTTFGYDELGERYRVDHHGTDGALRYRQQRYWHGADVVFSRGAWVVDGEEQGDLGARIDEQPMLGVSHLVAPLDHSFFAPLAAYDQFNPDNPLDSVYAATRYDGAGAVVASFTTAYGAWSGRPSLRATWRTLHGDRLKEEQTISWDPIDGKATEISHLTMEHAGEQGGNERVRRVRHFVTHEPELDALPWSPLQLVGDTKLGEITVERRDDYAFEYTGGVLPLHDGCSGGSCGVGAPRHRYVFDAFDQLAAVLADEPQACTAPGPLDNDVVPVAAEYRVAWDGLGRRAYEDYPLPEGCSSASSALDGEMPRGFVYLGEELLAERFDVAWDHVPGSSLYVHGADDLPFVAAIFRPTSGAPQQAHYEILEDSAGMLVGLRGAGVYRRPGAPAGEIEAVESRSKAWFRPYATLRIDRSVSWPMRWLGGGAESVAFGKLSFHDAGGYTVDLTTNPEADRWYATRPAGFFGTLRAIGSFLVSLVVDSFRDLAQLFSQGADLFAGLRDGASWPSLRRRASRVMHTAGQLAFDAVVSAFTAGTGGVAARAGRKALRRGVNDAAERALRAALMSPGGGRGLTFHGDAALAFLARNGLTAREVASFAKASEKLGGGLEIAIRSFKKKAPYRQMSVEAGRLAKPLWQKGKTNAIGLQTWKSGKRFDPRTGRVVRGKDGEPVPLHDITVTGDVDLGYVLKDGVSLEREAVEFRRLFRGAYRELPGPHNPTIKHGPHLDLRHVEPGDFRFQRGRARDEALGIRNARSTFQSRADVNKTLEKIGPPGHMFTLSFDSAGRLTVKRLGVRDNVKMLMRLQPKGGWPRSWFTRTLKDHGVEQ